ncbi:DUF418 domain-containing protein [Bowmanella dokdonensis]|uniref:DUF418 domain-containing protein n=1 Tax=Bowmanella dokdonensis TaxID=751969 RepID=A0A939IR61_9ALTE|nr:DUF418 domain-containing protein [Bowmanella dokdonensis]MBN7825166.1 DUF418 domain-containing protein [Bowmanella dokdonensis]
MDSLVPPHSEPSKPELKPVEEGQRLDVLDILRGFALLGILFMNVEWFNRPMTLLGSADPSLTGWDHTSAWLIRLFVEGKFYKLFALLFGMGFAVMLNKALMAGKPFTGWFSRRMGILFLFGFAHMVFLWGGDILHDYAIAGFMLMGLIMLLQTDRFRRFNRPSRLLKLALFWLGLPVVAMLALAILLGASSDNQDLQREWQDEKALNAKVQILLSQKDAALEKQADQVQENEAEPEKGALAAIEQDARELAGAKREEEQQQAEEIQALSEGSYWQATRHRAQYALLSLAYSPLLAVLLFVPLFLLGYWLILSQRIVRYRQYQGFYRILAWWGTSTGLLMAVPALMLLHHPVAEQAEFVRVLADGLFFASQYFMTAGYLGLIMRALTWPAWRRLLQVLAPFGRMALTHYLLQSLILSSLFYGYGAGLYGQLGRSWELLLCLLVVAVQVPLSHWWLKHFRFGPMEWLWRCLSYQQWQPMRR